MASRNSKISAGPLRLNINIEDTMPITCACGNAVFLPGIVVRYLSAIQSPNGQPTLIEAPVMICSKCSNAYTREDVLKHAKEAHESKIIAPKES